MAYLIVAVVFLGFGNLASPFGVDETFELDEMGVVMNRSSLEESRSHSAFDTFQAAMDRGPTGSRCCELSASRMRMWPVP